VSTEILTFLTWFLLVPTLAVYGVVRVSRSTPAERRAMQTLDAVRTAFELSLGEQYSTYEGVFEGHAMRVSLTPALQRPPSLLQPLHTLLVLLAIAFGIALLGIPGLDGLACAIATLATLLVLGVVTVGGLTRQFRASTVRVRAEVHVPRAEGVDIAHDIERPYLTGDPVFDDQFSAGGDRVATMALLGPEERRALVANAGLELRHNTVRRFLGDPTRAVDDVRAMAKVADALTSDLAPMPRLLRRIVSERGEAERLAAIDTLLHVRGPSGGAPWTRSTGCSGSPPTPTPSPRGSPRAAASRSHPSAGSATTGCPYTSPRSRRWPPRGHDTWPPPRRRSARASATPPPVASTSPGRPPRARCPRLAEAAS
jgi:hypothetical protein